MKVLSIKQPWVWLICAGYKDIENRDWFIGRKPALGGRFQNRGLELPARIYVHAGKTFDDDAWEVIMTHVRFGFSDSQDKLREAIRINDENAVLLSPDFDKSRFTLGAIIGEVDITGCVDESDSPWFTGKYGFTLANPALYDKPIPCRGQLGFFDIPEEVIHGQKV